MKTEPKEKFKVVSRDPKMGVATEIIAENIMEIARGVKAMRNSRLNDEAVVTLLHRSCQSLSRSQIGEMLRALDSLERTYLKPVKH